MKAELKAKIKKLFGLNRVGSLKSLLLYWIIGSGVALVVVYSSLMGQQFKFGAMLITQGNLEWYAVNYEAEYLKDNDAPLPSQLGLFSYRDLRDIPPALLRVFEDSDIIHRELEVFLEHKFTGQPEVAAFHDEQLCEIRVCDLIFFYPYQMVDGQWLYLVQGLAGNEQLYKSNDMAELFLLLFALVVLTSIGGIAWLLIRKVSSPVEELAIWAKELKNDKVANTPNFKYKELNQVAVQLTEAFISIRASVEKERQFLQQASHELRTPLATASGNMDILNLISQKVQRSEVEQEALSRLSHAINDMTQLTDTILWLNRDTESLPAQSQVDIEQLVAEIVEENQYLLFGKAVEVDITGQASIVTISAVLGSIVLSNLIRNAFQYTFVGKVTIALRQHEVAILNENNVVNNEQNNEVYGFGLGLTLVAQIIERMHWHCSSVEQQNGWLSTVAFLPPVD
jgi:signal transduction histidine kinase